MASFDTYGRIPAFGHRSDRILQRSHETRGGWRVPATHLYAEKLLVHTGTPRFLRRRKAHFSATAACRPICSPCKGVSDRFSNMPERTGNRPDSIRFFPPVRRTETLAEGDYRIQQKSQKKIDMALLQKLWWWFFTQTFLRIRIPHTGFSSYVASPLFILNGNGIRIARKVRIFPGAARLGNPCGRTNKNLRKRVDRTTFPYYLCRTRTDHRGQHHDFGQRFPSPISTMNTKN